MSSSRSTYLQVVFIFLAFATMVLVSYVYVSKIVKAQIQSYGDSELDSAAIRIHNIFKETEYTLNDVTFFTERILNSGGTNGDVLDMFIDWSDDVAIYGYIGGEYLSGSGWVPPEGYDPETRPWYVGAVEKNGDFFYTSPYFNYELNNTVISISKMIFDKSGNPLGVISTDSRISNVMDFVRTLTFEGKGYGVLINDAHRFVVHPEDAYLLEDITQESDVISSSFAEVGMAVVQRDTLSAVQFYDKEDKIGFFTDIFNGWCLGIILPKSEYYGNVVRMAVTLSAIGSVLMFVLSYLLVSMSLARSRADRASRVKTSFLADMSHEIRTPMTAIMGMSELILREENVPERVRDYAGDIKTASTSLLGIVNEILDISKIESGKLELFFEEYEFPSMLNDVISLIRIRIGDRPISFTVDVNSNLPHYLTGDELRIRQILTNILSNAVKFTNEGYVRFGVTGDVFESKAVLRFEIADSGAGIKPEDLGRLFREFEQVDTRRNRGMEGTGLGLSITKKLCEMMNGELLVESEYGTGSTFTIIIEQPFRAYEPLVVVESAPENGVIILEPSLPVLQSVKLAVEGSGASCRACQTVSIFCEELAVKKYDYAFVSSAKYEMVEDALRRLQPDIKPVVIADYNFIPERNMPTLVMPVTCLQVGSLFNNSAPSAYYSETDPELAPFTAPDANILIVDDNATNLKVAAGLLAPYQMKVHTAMSGFEALEYVRLRIANFDIIFMDHMMPVMDGIETASEIRKTSVYYQTAPIIALTANAITGARELFLQNGMNDFLSKPIDSKALHNILKRYIPKAKRHKASAAIKTESADFSIEGVNTRKGIKNCGNTIEGYLSVLSVFQFDGTNKLPILLEMHHSGSYQDFVTLVHALKGASANVGAEGVSELAGALEDAARQGDAEYIGAHIGAFADMLAKLLENISSFIKSRKTDAQENAKPPGDSGELKEKIKALIGYMEIADSNNIDKTLAALGEFSWNPDVAERIAGVRQYSDLFDFDESIKIAKEILEILV